MRRAPGTGEFSKIARLAALFGGHEGPGVEVGIGDDAAVLSPRAGRRLVWTVDAQVEGQHFRRDWMTWGDVGWRSFVGAASDLGAMGAEPWCALSSLVLPEGFPDDALDALSRGQAEAALAAGCPIVGGNLSRGGELSVTTTLLGSVDRAVRRSGAQVGDGIWLAGPVGLAGAGLRALLMGKIGGDFDAAIAAFRRPRMSHGNGSVLGAYAHAAIDISDGLARDAAHLAEASRVALVLDEPMLLLHAGEIVRRVGISLNEPAIRLVLTGGEDYALFATSAEPLAGFTRVGDVVPELAQGVWLRAAGGAMRRLSEIELGGFDHFAISPD